MLNYDIYYIWYMACHQQLKQSGDLDKVAIRKEIGGAENLDPKLRKSLELLSLTCRGTTFTDVSYFRYVVTRDS